jgi:hypothetical protein
MTPSVPSVIRVEEDAVSIVSTIDIHRPVDNGNGTQHAVLNGRTKRVLPHSRYQKGLESIIQRDYFPSPLAPPSSTQPDPSLDTATTLTHFHSGAASDRQLSFQLKIDEYAREKRAHAERTKYMDSSTDQNAVFFPVIPRGTPRNRILTGGTAESSTAPTDSWPISNTNRTIVPDATRFPQPKQKVPQHWEKESTMDDASSSNDCSTDLDSTIVVSLRSEIRRGRLRKIRESSAAKKRSSSSSTSTTTQRRTIRPPLDSDEAIGWALRKAYKRPRRQSSAASVKP